jgi:hypothetical protein
MSEDEDKRKRALDEFVIGLADRDAEFGSKAYRSYCWYRLFFWAVVVLTAGIPVIGVLLKEDPQNCLWQWLIIGLPFSLPGVLWLIERESENLDYLDDFQHEFRTLHLRAKQRIANADTGSDYAAVHAELLEQLQEIEKRRGRRHRGFLRRILRSIKRPRRKG